METTASPALFEIGETFQSRNGTVRYFLKVVMNGQVEVRVSRAEFGFQQANACWLKVGSVNQRISRGDWVPFDDRPEDERLPDASGALK